ncbi:hypothetical protein [Agrococcus sp. ARC_14]|uniref:hypothetical protein n=1 Tax=Agrococcus sp. ARC_14 TaxID=2919927 RepID=UPI001F0533CA|nr:hypothetical protein [Agrococcus sp. ARC_14]MCH1882402.1 hypothetical protein [Agrococcus sp. ARC_14]
MHALFVQELPYDPNQVTPGVIGFAVTALVAVAVILLLWDFNRRVRRINDRADARERLLAEVAAAQRPARADAGVEGAASDTAASAEGTPSITDEPGGAQPPRA